ncbi:MAG: lipase, partial [Actinomycetota bacterium]|nr:lipase [Actinomycetota bacterium]
PLWVSIWTADDKVVTPPSSAELDDALNFSVQSICPGVVVTHSGLPRLGFVIAATVNALEVAIPSLPDDGAC